MSGIDEKAGIRMTPPHLCFYIFIQIVLSSVQKKKKKKPIFQDLFLWPCFFNLTKVDVDSPLFILYMLSNLMLTWCVKLLGGICLSHLINFLAISAFWQILCHSVLRGKMQQINFKFRASSSIFDRSVKTNWWMMSQEPRRSCTVMTTIMRQNTFSSISTRRERTVILMQ